MRRPEGFTVYAEGGWQKVRFRHGGRRYKIALGTRDPGEAAQLAPVVYAEVVQGQRTPGRLAATVATPLDELVALWLDSLSAPGGLDVRTVQSYLYYARAQWLPRWQRLGQLTATALRAYCRERLGEVTRSTVRKEASALRGLLGWARDQELLDVVPEVELPHRGAGTRQHTRRPVPLSPAEVAAILAQLPEDSRGRPVRGYAEFLWETALRPSTVAALSVPEHWRPGAPRLQLRDEDDKARWGRPVPLSARAIELLARHAPAAGVIWGRYRLLEALKAAALAAGLAPERAARVAPYDLRHARLTALAEAGATRGALQLLAGHTQAATTDHYLHPVEGAALAALAAVQAPDLCPPGASPLRGAIGPAVGSVSPGEGPRCEGPAREVCSQVRLRSAQGGT